MIHRPRIMTPIMHAREWRRTARATPRHDTVILEDLHIPPPDVKRPQTRGECIHGPRPCPWVGCRYHLYLDEPVAPGVGRMKLCFPHLEPWEVPHTCALDLADAGSCALDEIGAAMNLSAERVRQLESKALAKVAKAMKRSKRVDLPTHTTEKHDE